MRGRPVGHGVFGPNTPVGGMRLTLHNNRFGRHLWWYRELMAGLPLEISLQAATLLKYGFRTDLYPRTFAFRTNRAPVSDIGTIRLW